MNAEPQNGALARTAPQEQHPRREVAPGHGWIEHDGIEFDDRAVVVRAVEDEEPERLLPILSDEELLSLMDPAKLVLDRIPLALLADLVSPFGPDSERLLAEES
ncbi:hypothetical protein HF995_01240 [Sanguibacter hominis ATCC BAA-789]|uniref:Uncharacterized protein n=1 Tax=Sanguibacter hominis ATCC BAA-789 TaxID=1312740 RepID=A0A9X5INA8_9MICO|nr:hypothetical protein [Sanguibacter hominis]NKX91907.1 hypothetical protein [Sanguibacter hominis ATCC BAA-789]